MLKRFITLSRVNNIRSRILLTLDIMDLVYHLLLNNEH